MTHRRRAPEALWRFPFRRFVATCLILAALVGGAHHVLAAPEHSGQVTFGGLPVPGATVTASAGDRQLITATDEQGVFKFSDVADGLWTIRVEMLGFATVSREVTIAAGVASTWTLALKPFDEITRGLPPPPAPTAQTSPPPSALSPSTGARQSPAPPSAAVGRGGFQRAGVTASPGPPPAAVANRAAAGAATDEPGADAGPGAADGFLINGSVNNGAASPFAQAAAFGNNRRGRGSLFNGGLAVVLGNSRFDSSPFTFGSLPAPKPEYNDLRVIGTFGGPLRFSKVLRNGPTLFAAFQHADDHNATTQPGVMPTLAERNGDFSQSRDAAGRSVQILDPATGQPFPGGVIPSTRISPQATALLGYYPQPNLLSAGAGYNFQAPLITGTRQDLVTTRVTQPINNRNQLIGTFAYQRTATDQTTLFGFADTSGVSGVDTSLAWTHRVNQLFSLRLRYQFTEVTTSATPYFANRTNVSGDAGITGNNQEPANWGPPSLIFSSVTGLTDALPAFTRNQTDGGGIEGYLSRGRHNITVGGDLRRNHIDIQSQQNPRGTFAFTGAATGSDFGDFLLGIPATSSIAFGNADKYLRAFSSDAYITDDMRLSPMFTVQAGARWEYETPLTEAFGRLVNLDVAPGFTAISPVLAGAVGSVTGQPYPASLLRPDRLGIQPRVGVAWRPVPGSSLVIRAGYGIYRNTSVYQPITTLLAQQPPLSKAFTLANSAANPLTLANGFTAPATATLNTFAVDPDLRVGSSQNWQALIQRDLPGSLTVSATYLGTKGSNLMQEFLPNTYPAGAVNPCPTCPAGFIYLTSNGSSSRHAGQWQLRRRLRNGLAASVQYTLAKATDNATAFAGVNLSGAAIAQDWRNLEAEQAPSNFDQRHQVAAQFQYTTGLGVGGGALLDGMKGQFFKGWTVTSQLTTGSGMPVTPVYLAPVPGTGVTGSLRPSLSGVSVAAPAGYYLNPAAYVVPPAGQWGSAGRNSIAGPAQFSLNAAVARVFQWTERLSLDWRLDATNVLNRETYTGVNTSIGGPQFGLPNLANTPRKIQSTMRLRF
jgi:trimeric autotransporter adhesin